MDDTIDKLKEEFLFFVLERQPQGDTSSEAYRRFTRDWNLLSGNKKVDTYSCLYGPFCVFTQDRRLDEVTKEKLKSKLFH